MSFHVEAPFSPFAQAAKLWNVPTPVSSRREEDLIITKRSDDISIQRDRNYGGLNTDVDRKTEVFYDPRTKSMRAPIEGSTIAGTAHGPSAFVADSEPRAKVQYSTNNDTLVLEPVILNLRTRDCRCISECALSALTPYSMATLMYNVNNAINVRCLMQKAGLVLVSPALAAHRPLCPCAVFGDEDEFTQGLFASAMDYNTTPIITMQNPAELVDTLNVKYVNGLLTNIRYNTNTRLIYNYAKTEGNMAYMQSYPDYRKAEESLCDEERYANLQLQNPNALNRRYQCELARQTGLPIYKKP